MKLATLKNGTRDGKLVVVSRDLTRAVEAGAKVPTMQAAIEHWEQVLPYLQDLSDRLNSNDISGAIPFHSSDAAAPLPRAYQFVDASSFLNHGSIMEKAFKVAPQVPPGTPILVQRQGDDFCGPNDDYVLVDEAELGDFEGEIAVIVDDIPFGTKADQTMKHIRLLMILNDVSMRAHVGREMGMGFGFIQAKPATTFGPVAVTPDELGVGWSNGRVCLDLHVHRNGELFGHPNGREMDYSFGQLLQHLCHNRNLRAGTVLGTGTFSNVDHETVGSACLAERRALETIAHGEAKTPFLQYGDRLRFEMFGADGHSIFGAIDQRFVPPATR
ncbi:fumarylacetoacetate hydrolase family protein [Noviherbaspirillum sp. Root189]|uniref:fumarylacetoacetate hydrolase family protein n=1 Tax=Noviherbaspirillum sp. Root189 TaxID=1736487 RepID=UPI00070D89CD|nr:fumarylacetoacetate hydrolase family protein [Noviherbaspirillum sp. Root189]KRB93552.1 fumarylacetoacetate hydrolase [Noviherbaspirillum sp. Root189]